MDLSWWGSYDGEYWHDFILHMERENFFKKDMETLDKLFCDREYTPINIIGIMNVRSRVRIDELVETAKTTCKIDNAVLVFKTTSSGKSQPYFDEVHAYLLNKSEIIEKKMAFVSDISGTLYMQFEKTL
ncbi:hypothetical protein [Paenibacillus periandrae]|uniref:hypothetical protein n=1 Tax=Paenibacillus periandrae TaxID=1761741 RepID=UPI001F09563C|nr:hypothetical protein [Paenibacillus periandrae]